MTGGGDTGEGEVRFWDAATGAPRGRLRRRLPGVVWQVAFSPDGKTFATASGENAAQLWDAQTRQPLGEPLLHQNRVVALAFRPDGEALLTGSTDKTARLWEVPGAKPLGEPLPHEGAVWAVAFTPDGETLVTGSREGRDGAAHLWDAATGTPIGPPLPHRSVVWAVACHGRTVVTGSGDKTVRLWQLPPPVEGELERVVLWVQVSTAMELDDNGAVHLLDAPTWRQRRQRLQELGGPPLPWN